MTAPVAYYNEFDPKAAAWLRELIKRNIIAPGVVDERSIEDVKPSELEGFTQVHFFAGIGVWSYALRRAGWPDDRPVWTGSCPCQPFSAAGKGAGFTDERHLWPAFYHLITQRAPLVVFGEQVASKDGLAWFDTVQADLEGAGYTSGAVDICAAGVGAPHIRQRLYFAAERLGHADESGLQKSSGFRRNRSAADETAEREALIGTGSTSGLDDPAGPRHERPVEEPESKTRDETRLRLSGTAERSSGVGHTGSEPSERNAGTVCSPEAQGHSERVENGGVGNGHTNAGGASGLANSQHTGHGGSETDTTEPNGDGPDERLSDRGYPILERRPPTGPTNGIWGPADWLFCRDGKWRPVRPGTFPLVNGAAARVGRLRGYGNAINAEVARLFVESFLDSESLY